MTVSNASPSLFKAHFPQNSGAPKGESSFRPVIIGNRSPLQRSASMNDLHAPDRNRQGSFQGNMSCVFEDSGSVSSLDSGRDVEMTLPSGLRFGMDGRPDAGGNGVGRADYREQLKRAHPLDPAGQSATHQLQHTEDVHNVLASVLQRWDAEHPEMSEPVTNATTPTPVALTSKAQTTTSIQTREQCARDTLTGLGVSPARIDDLLKGQASSRGGAALIDACRLLSMPEVRANGTACKNLEKHLKSYLQAANGDYSGVARSFSGDAFSELSKLTSSIEKTVDTIGRETIQDRLLADETSALMAALARKNPAASPEVLRRSLSDLINTQGFSAFTERLKGADASGLLQDAPLLSQLAQAADNPKRPPADKAATPVGEFVKHLQDVLGAMKAPVFLNFSPNTVNQNDWKFQGVNDPRPEKAVEPQSQPLPALPEIPALEPQLLERIAEVADELIIEDAVPVPDDNPPPPPPPLPQPPMGSGRHGAPVHPLHGNLLKELKENARFIDAQNGVVRPQEPYQRWDGPLPTDEEEETRNRTIRNAGQRERTLPLTRLAAPIPLGQHASDLPNVKRDAGT